jgi:hypothetical protein
VFEQEPLSVSLSLALHNVQLSVKVRFCDTVTMCQTVQKGSVYGSLQISPFCRSVCNNIQMYLH